MQDSVIHQYGDVFLAYLQKEDSLCSYKNKQHCLKYVYSGEMCLEENGVETRIHQGECVFIRRDHRVHITKHAYGDDLFRGITLMFKRDFLRNKYAQGENAYCKKLSNDMEPFKQSVIKLPSVPQLKSLFLSITPYFDSPVEPSVDLMKLKMEEGLLALLEMDKRFYPLLFDFTEPWKIDLEEFMNENYTCDLTIEEFANYTGRSLATFKRDFKKISELPPQKWIIQKRLEKAYELIAKEHKGINETCFEVGFKNRSHFATAFKRQYGITPSLV